MGIIKPQFFCSTTNINTCIILVPLLSQSGEITFFASVDGLPKHAQTDFDDS